MKKGSVVLHVKDCHMYFLIYLGNRSVYLIRYGIVYRVDDYQNLPDKQKLIVSRALLQFA